MNAWRVDAAMRSSCWDRRSLTAALSGQGRLRSLREALRQIGHVAGITNALHTLYSSADLADNWVQRLTRRSTAKHRLRTCLPEVRQTLKPSDRIWMQHNFADRPHCQTKSHCSSRFQTASELLWRCGTKAVYVVCPPRHHCDPFFPKLATSISSSDRVFVDVRQLAFDRIFAPLS